MHSSEISLEPQLSGAELAALVGLLRRAGLNGTHLEIGTAAGGTLRELLRTYQAKTLPPFVVIDTFAYFPNQRAVVEDNLKAAGIDPGNVDFRETRSYAAVHGAIAAKESFAFIFIDGQHDATHVMQDLLWTRMLEVGGYVCLHDYAQRFPGVMWAIDTFLRKHPNFRRVDVVDSLIILQKMGINSAPEVSRFDLATAYAFRLKCDVVNSTKKLCRAIGLTAQQSKLQLIQTSGPGAPA